MLEPHVSHAHSPVSLLSHQSSLAPARFSSIALPLTEQGEDFWVFPLFHGAARALKNKSGSSQKWPVTRGFHYCRAVSLFHPCFRVVCLTLRCKHSSWISVWFSMFMFPQHPVYCVNVVGTQNAHNLITVSTDGKMCSWSLDMLSTPQVGLFSPTHKSILVKRDTSLMEWSS